MIMIINFVFGLLILPRCYSNDAITAGNLIRDVDGDVLLSGTKTFALGLTAGNLIRDVDGDVLLSGTKTFALGFFSPGKSRNRYVGIWYSAIPDTVIWVANRDDPINDTSGVLAVDGLRGLAIYAGVRKLTVWSANVSLGNGSAPVARLLDVGNLALSDQRGRVIWQSFDHPTDTMIPFMTLGVYRRSRSELFLTSWKSADDPGTGTSSYRIDPNGYPQSYLYKGWYERI